ncbi:NDP-hexose 2,3-dehydratase family protein [Saccharothrix isguenensis]
MGAGVAHRRTESARRRADLPAGRAGLRHHRRPGGGHRPRGRLLERVSSGLASFRVRCREGVPQVLAPADLWPGYRDVVELGPTVQCAPAAVADGARTWFLDDVLVPGADVHYDVVQSEEERPVPARGDQARAGGGTGRAGVPPAGRGRGGRARAVQPPGRHRGAEPAPVPVRHCPAR